MSSKLLKLIMNNSEENNSLKETRKLYYQKNKEKIRVYKKLWKIKNREHVKEKDRIYYQENKKEILDKHKMYYNSDLNTSRKLRLDHYYKNKDTILKQRLVYQKLRRKNDPTYKILLNLRRRLNTAIKSQGAKKSIKTLDGFGCTSEFLRNHLESQFKEGMSWDNHAPKGWHVDHIKPCSAFDLNNPEEQMLVNHYTNLQPLWWWENLQKSDKIIPLTE